MPLFLCWEPESGYTIHDAREVESFDAEDAATDYAEADYNDESWDQYRCAKGIVVAVIAAPEDHNAPLPDPEGAERFDVQIEFDPTFYAFKESKR